MTFRRKPIGGDIIRPMFALHPHLARKMADMWEWLSDRFSDRRGDEVDKKPADDDVPPAIPEEDTCASPTADAVDLSSIQVQNNDEASLRSQPVNEAAPVSPPPPVSQSVMKTPILDVGRAAENDDVTKVTGYLLSTRRLLSWRPTGNSPYGAKKRRHADPRQVKEGLEGICLMAAIDQPMQLKYLLSLTDADVNMRDPDGDRSALHWAAVRGHLRCLNLLLDAGADLTLRDKDGMTAAALAIEYNQDNVATMLAQHAEASKTPVVQIA